MADLQHAGWRIRLTAVEQHREIFESVGKTGGYVFTHLGRIERADGSLFNAQDATAVIEALRRFLSFARGAACSIPVRWGSADEGSVVWENWISQPLDPWKGRDTWFDEHHGNLLGDLFSPFAQLAEDTDLGAPFGLALHWFQKCNTRAGGMEGAIILGLTALDLLGAMVVVDRAKVMSDAKYDKLSAKEKLARLLGVLKVPASIPQHPSLRNYRPSRPRTGGRTPVKPSRKSATATCTRTRGAARPFCQPPTMRRSARGGFRSGIRNWPFIYLLGHQGEYRNRVTAKWLGQVEQVPWV